MHYLYAILTVGFFAQAIMNLTLHNMLPFYLALATAGIWGFLTFNEYRRMKENQKIIVRAVNKAVKDYKTLD